jgi:hypothetical protein
MRFFTHWHVYRFIPNLAISQVLSRDKNKVRLLQVFVQGFLSEPFNIDVVSLNRGSHCSHVTLGDAFLLFEIVTCTGGMQMSTLHGAACPSHS